MKKSTLITVLVILTWTLGPEALTGLLSVSHMQIYRYAILNTYKVVNLKWECICGYVVGLGMSGWMDERMDGFTGMPF